jgi:hypothetical protein
VKHSWPFSTAEWLARPDVALGLYRRMGFVCVHVVQLHIVDISRFRAGRERFH